MKPFLKYLAASTLVMGVIICACANDEGRGRIREFKESFLDFVEGRDDVALLKYVPSDVTNLKVTMDSGRTVFVPQSLDDVESIFEDAAEQLSGDDVSVIQSNETESAESVALTFTMRIVDGSMERTLPVRAALEKDEASGKWVMVALDLYN
jgi:hypothetical protein